MQQLEEMMAHTLQTSEALDAVEKSTAEWRDLVSLLPKTAVVLLLLQLRIACLLQPVRDILLYHGACRCTSPRKLPHVGLAATKAQSDSAATRWHVLPWHANILAWHANI